LTGGCGSGKWIEEIREEEAEVFAEIAAPVEILPAQ